MTNERAHTLMKEFVGYIRETISDDDELYNVLENAIGMTENEIDEVVENVFVDYTVYNVGFTNTYAEADETQVDATNMVDLVNAILDLKLEMDIERITYIEEEEVQY